MDTATLNRLTEQDWPIILDAASKGLLFTTYRVRLPNGEIDAWLAPEPGSIPPDYTEIKEHAFEIAHCALCEVHKRIGRAAMDGSDEGAAVAAAAPAYKALFEVLDVHGRFTSIDSAPVVLEALRVYRAAICKLMTAYVNKQGPRSLIALGNVEPRD